MIVPTSVLRLLGCAPLAASLAPLAPAQSKPVFTAEPTQNRAVFTKVPGTLTTSDAANGKPIYDVSCQSCHKNGVMGAPKVGDKATWAPRIAQGLDKLVSNSIKGYKGAKGMMPPKGGNPKLTDSQVRYAVEYMVQQSR